MNKKLIATYGSLRKNHGNWSWALNCEPLSTEVVNINYRMVSLGGFPGLIPDEERHDIVVELYEVDDKTYKAIEALEGFPRFYQKAKIETSLGECEVYVLEDKQHYESAPAVEHGDWNKHYSPRYGN